MIQEGSTNLDLHNLEQVQFKGKDIMKKFMTLCGIILKDHDKIIKKCIKVNRSG